MRSVFLGISLWASPAWHVTLGNLYGVALDDSVRLIPSPGLISSVNGRKLSVFFRRDGEAVRWKGWGTKGVALG